MFLQKDIPTLVMQLFTLTSDVHWYNTCGSQQPYFEHRATSIAAKSIVHSGPKVWSSLPLDLKSIPMKSSFAKKKM